MAEKKDLGAAKRFGARYGRTVKHKLAKIEREQKKKHKCPYCSKLTVKRIFAGVWHCKHCGVKFTNKAYTISKKTLTIKKDKTIEIKDIPDFKKENSEQIEEAES
jgi:large subunit ribosomal protein L37Ae